MVRAFLFVEITENQLILFIFAIPFSGNQDIVWNEHTSQDTTSPLEGVNFQTHMHSHTHKAAL